MAGINFNMKVNTTGSKSVEKMINLYKDMGNAAKNVTKEVNKFNKANEKLENARNLVSRKENRYNYLTQSMSSNGQSMQKLSNTQKYLNNLVNERYKKISYIEEQGPDSDYAKKIGFNIVNATKKYSDKYKQIISEINARTEDKFNTTPTSVEELKKDIDRLNESYEFSVKSMNAANQVFEKSKEKVNEYREELNNLIVTNKKGVDLPTVRDYFADNQATGPNDLKEILKDFKMRPNIIVKSQMTELLENIQKESLKNFNKTNNLAHTLAIAQDNTDRYAKAIGLANSMLEESEKLWDKVSKKTQLVKENVKDESSISKMQDTILKKEDRNNSLNNKLEDTAATLDYAKSKANDFATLLAANPKLQILKGTGKILLGLANKMYQKLKLIRKEINNIYKGLSKKIEKSLYSIMHVFRYMILRMTFRALIKEFATFFNKYTQYSDDFAEKFNELYNTFMKLQASVVAMIAPLIKAVEPLLIALGNALIKLLNIMNMFNAIIINNQTTWSKAKDLALDYKEALDETGKSAGKNLAAFDTINKLGTGSNSGNTLDNLDASKIWEEVDPEQWVIDLKESLTNGWLNNDLTETGIILGDKVNEIIDNALDAFNESNISEKLNGKISGIRKGLTAFLNKINEEDENGVSHSFKLGILAANIVNSITSAIIEIFKSEENGDSWYKEIGLAIANFIAGAVENIQWENIGNVVASIKNAISKFWNEFTKRLNEKDDSGKSTASKIGEALALVFNAGIDNWDAEAAGVAASEKMKAVLDAAISFLSNAEAFKAGAKSGQKLATSLQGLGTKIIEVIGLSLWDGIKYLAGYLIGVIGGAAVTAAKQAEEDTSSEVLSTIGRAIIAVIGMALIAVSTVLTGGLSSFLTAALGSALLGGATAIETGKDFTEIKDAYNNLGNSVSDELIVGMNIEEKTNTELLNAKNSINSNSSELENESRNMGLLIAKAYAAELNSDEGLAQTTSDALTDVNTTLNNNETVLESSADSDGQYIIQGLNDGLNNESKRKTLSETVQGLFDSVAGFFEKLFDINSPSKVFEQDGQYIVQGLNNGLNSETIDTSFTSSLTSSSDEDLSQTLENFNIFKNNLTDVFDSINDMFKTHMEDMVSTLNVTMQCVTDGINDMADKMNSMIDDYNAVAKETGASRIKNYIHGVTMKNIELPKLAQGAVIPPNREFLAVLGDQKQGTNVETPLETIKQALREVQGENGSRGMTQLNIECDKRTFAKLIVDLSSNESRRVGARMVTE